MHLLRSRLFSILIAALVIIGYSEVARGACGHEAFKTTAGAGQAVSHSHSDSESSHGEGEACQCICHQSFVSEQPAKPFAAALHRLLSLVLERADTPPDADPLGIDYPPQLA